MFQLKAQIQNFFLSNIKVDAESVVSCMLLMVLDSFA